MKKLLVNPFNPIGEFHNRGLDYLISNLTLHPFTANHQFSHIPEDDFSKIIDITARFGSSDTLLAGCCRGYSYIDLYQSLANFWNNQRVKSDSSHKYFSDNQVNIWLSEIWQIPDDESLSYQEKRNILLDLEQRILWDSGSPELKSVPLIGLAVAKSSLFYWYDVSYERTEQGPVSKTNSSQSGSTEESVSTQPSESKTPPRRLWKKLLGGWRVLSERKGSKIDALLGIFKEDTKGALEGAQDPFISLLTSATVATSPAAPLHGLSLFAAICGTKAIVKSGTEAIELASQASKEIQEVIEEGKSKFS